MKKKLKTLGLLTLKRGVSNLQTVMKSKVKLCLLTYTQTKGDAKQYERVKWKNKDFFI